VRPSSAARPYVIAALAIVIALAVRALMAPLWETTAPFALFMFATALTAWFAGTGPALVTGAAGVLTRVYFDAPAALARAWEEDVRLALFVVYVIAVAIVLSRVREDRRALDSSVESARRELDERRRAEAALRASEQRLQQLADAMPQIVWTAGENGVEFLNRRWTEYTGLTLEESLDEDGWTRAVHPEDVDAARQAGEVARVSGAHEWECRLKHHESGAWRWFLCRVVSVSNADGRRWFGTCTDIEERKRTERVLDERRLAAEDANRLKDEFIAVVSHELRTPLNAILGWSSLLRSGTLSTDRMPHALDVIARNARRQSEIVGDLIDAARSITGQIRLEPLRVDLLDPVYSAVRSLRPAADARSIVLVVSASPVPLLVWGDTNRLEQVVGHLLTNAVKFTPAHGRVEVQLAARGGFAEISVTDTGIGIDQHTLPFVFDRFHQGDSSPTRQHGGLGLGLTIVRHIVELHHGSVEARSDGPGKGATFTIRLPLLDVSADRHLDERLTEDVSRS